MITDFKAVPFSNPSYIFAYVSLVKICRLVSHYWPTKSGVYTYIPRAKMCTDICPRTLSVMTTVRFLEHIMSADNIRAYYPAK